ncbi:hypothetical protein [Paracoccus spongiarum]|uniref:Uncharacterized protein n=1 Tax=Paracoccus spongiarum TaxID=3064387 RepID=A0ABT9JBN1_9RHOB|nr:hypothetical protein [Paracoccus sp. 2205BS29-5]MDP5307005.1 hypothetical protein [Paracoccus sp. 2205BS29-5]
MSVHPMSKFNDVIAALQLLGAVPGGAENDPACHALEALKAASLGRPGPGSPLPGPDRPTWAAFRRLERENQMLVDHAEMLACALGACPNCWGTIEDCEDCGGVGRPGAFAPDRACFDRFVLPVIARVMGHDDDRSEDDETPIPPQRRGRDHPLSTSL